MSAKYTGCVFGNQMHNCHCPGSPALDRWNDSTGHWYCPSGNDNCGAHLGGDS